jgi:TIR domain-containing protein
MQALKELGVTFFLDDAEWRKRKEDVDASGLQPGEDLLKALDAALRSSRVILLVHSPAYFVSRWCRWELELAEKLAAEPANSGGSLKLIYLILSRCVGRLDLSDEGERLLSVDLTNVRERAEKLSFALQSVNPKAKELRCTLGGRSLQDLLVEPEVQGQVNLFRERHKMFREAHEKMQAFKESHDAIQCAQDAWHALATARDNITAGNSVVTLRMAGDLAEKCNYVRDCIDAPVLAGERFAWRSQLDRAITAAAEFLTQTENLEVLNQTLERTRGFLFLSIAPTDLNNRIRAASEELPIDLLAGAVQPLKRLGQYPWQPEPLAKLGELFGAFDQLAALLAEINDLVAVHDALQNIDALFSTALNVEAKLADIENIWPDIEAERKRIDPRLVAAHQTLQLLGTAADTMSDYLHEPPQADKTPKNELESFKYWLNQSFMRMDTDLRQDTLDLEKKHENIDALLGRLASPS